MIYINTSAAPNMPDMMNPDNKAFIFNKDLDAQFLNELRTPKRFSGNS